MAEFFTTVDVLVTQMDAAQLPAYLALASELRGAGIATEVVLDGGKLAKQFKYADRAGVRFVIVLGEDEIAKGVHAGLVARRIRALQLRLDRLAREQESARRDVLAQGARAKLAEQAIEAAALDYGRLNERKALAEIIECALARSASSTQG